MYRKYFKNCKKSHFSKFRNISKYLITLKLFSGSPCETIVWSLFLNFFFFCCKPQRISLHLLLFIFKWCDQENLSCLLIVKSSKNTFQYFDINSRQDLKKSQFGFNPISVTLFLYRCNELRSIYKLRKTILMRRI